MAFALMSTVQNGLCWGLIMNEEKYIHIWASVPLGWFEEVMA